MASGAPRPPWSWVLVAGLHADRACVQPLHVSWFPASSSQFPEPALAPNSNLKHPLDHPEEAARSPTRQGLHEALPSCPLGATARGRQLCLVFPPSPGASAAVSPRGRPFPGKDAKWWLAHAGTRMRPHSRALRPGTGTAPAHTPPPEQGAGSWRAPLPHRPPLRTQSCANQSRPLCCQALLPNLITGWDLEGGPALSRDTNVPRATCPVPQSLW